MRLLVTLEAFFRRLESCLSKAFGPCQAVGVAAAASFSNAMLELGPASILAVDCQMNEMINQKISTLDGRCWTRWPAHRWTPLRSSRGSRCRSYHPLHRDGTEVLAAVYVVEEPWPATAIDWNGELPLGPAGALDQNESCLSVLASRELFQSQQVGRLVRHEPSVCMIVSGRTSNASANLLRAAARCRALVYTFEAQLDAEAASREGSIALLASVAYYSNANIMGFLPEISSPDRTYKRGRPDVAYT